MFSGENQKFRLGGGRSIQLSYGAGFAMDYPAPRLESS